MNDDLNFFEATTEDETAPASCGFRPTHGWPHKWARDHHRDTCDTCGQIEATKQLEQEKRTNGKA